MATPEETSPPEATSLEASVPPGDDGEAEFPAAWIWGATKGEKLRGGLVADGPVAAGFFDGWSRGPSEFGEKPILVLVIDGVRRSIWLNTDILALKVARKVSERPTRDFDAGERIVITRPAEKTQSKSGKTSYWSFSVVCPDEPPLSAAGALGATLKDVETGRLATEDDAGKNEEPKADEGIPF